MKKQIIAITVLLSIASVNAGKTWGEMFGFEKPKAPQGQTWSESLSHGYNATLNGAKSAGSYVWSFIAPEQPKQLSFQEKCIENGQKALSLASQKGQEGLKVALENKTASTVGTLVGVVAGWKLAGIGAGKNPTKKRRVAQTAVASVLGTAGAVGASQLAQTEGAQQAVTTVVTGASKLAQDCGNALAKHGGTALVDGAKSAFNAVSEGAVKYGTDFVAYATPVYADLIKQAAAHSKEITIGAAVLAALGAEEYTLGYGIKGVKGLCSCAKTEASQQEDSLIKEEFSLTEDQKAWIESNSILGRHNVKTERFVILLGAKDVANIPVCATQEELETLAQKAMNNKIRNSFFKGANINAKNVLASDEGYAEMQMLFNLDKTVKKAVYKLLVARFEYARSGKAQVQKALVKQAEQELEALIK